MYRNLRRPLSSVRYLIIVGVLALTGGMLSGCGVNLSAVNDFAKEGRLISSHKALLDDTEVQTQLWDLSHHTGPVDPESKEFKDTQAVTQAALKALNGYMKVLSQLSAKDVANVSSDFTTIDSDLTTLNVTNPKVRSGLEASGELAGILLDAAVRSDLKKLIVKAAEPVAQITTYLADQAQITHNVCIQAVAANHEYWAGLTNQTPADREFCSQHTICKPLYALANRALVTEDKDLNAKATAAETAAKAFQNIHDDNAALVSNVDHLDAKALTEILTNDEPYLISAINNLNVL